MSMTGPEIIQCLQTNIGDQISYIKKVEGEYNEGSLEGSDVLDAVVIEMDDPVKTQVRFSVYKGKLCVKISQLEPRPARVPYAQNY